MTAGLLVPIRRRPTPGVLYVGGVAVFAVLVLLFTAMHGMTPSAVALIGIPLGPLGVVAAAIALPVFTTVPSLATAAIVLAAAMSIAVVNVLATALITRAVAGEPLLRH